MFAKRFFSPLLVTLIGCGIFACAEARSLEPQPHHLIYKIIGNQECCVAGYEDDKIYIHEKNIIQTNRGLFVNLNGKDLYPLPVLQVNRSGYFVEGDFTHKMQLAADKKKDTRGLCPNCSQPTNKNGVCVNPACYFEGLRVVSGPR